MTKLIFSCLQRIVKIEKKIVHTAEPLVDLETRDTSIIGWDVKVEVWTITCGNKSTEMGKQHNM